MDSNLQVSAPAAAAAPVSSAEEEAIKKNTDCVYFLASPLTCKKGSECEYRHSDSARLNPRDCFYWMNGNCLNPKCAFRHPPLDGLLSPQAPNPAESFMPLVPMAPAAQAPYNSSKQGVPCIFFQKGICLKGDRCPFLHGPNSVTNKAPQKQGVFPTTEIPPKKMFGGIEKGTQEKNAPQINIQKTGEQPSVAKPVARGPALAKSHFTDKNMEPTPVIENESLKYNPASVPPNGNHVSRPSQMQHQHGFDDHQHSRDEEVSREASPGFDVLVDDELRDSDYYPVEDQYGPGDHEGNEYDIDHPADYSVRDLDQDMYRDARGYESYDRLPAHYAWEQRGASSERRSGRSGHQERRRHGNSDSSDQIDESDLRYRLSKQRRGDGLRSVVGHDYTRERHFEEQGYRASRRERTNLSSHENSVSNRLRGRIKIPGRSSSPTDVPEVHSDREMDRGRDHGRRSHGRPQESQHHGRLQDRIKGRVQEDPRRSGRGPISSGDMSSEDNLNFQGPKSLAELKGKKGSEGNGQQSLGKRKLLNYDDQLQSVEEPTFKGPMPLEEILKRKRKSGHNEDNQQGRTTPSEPTSSNKNVADLAVQNEGSQPPSGNNSGPFENQPAADPDEGEYQDEGYDGTVADDGAEYQDGEGYDQQDGDYNYEQVDGEDVNIDEAENDEEYPDEDDDDDFAKKMGVVFS